MKIKEQKINQNENKKWKEQKINQVYLLQSWHLEQVKYVLFKNVKDRLKQLLVLAYVLYLY